MSTIILEIIEIINWCLLFLKIYDLLLHEWQNFKSSFYLNYLIRRLIVQFIDFILVSYETVFDDTETLHKLYNLFLKIYNFFINFLNLLDSFKKSFVDFSLIIFKKHKFGDISFDILQLIHLGIRPLFRARAGNLHHQFIYLFQWNRALVHSQF